MIKSILVFCIAIAGYQAEAQNPPVIEKGAPKSNPTLPSNGTLGSNSGVNPAGNPGTIISYSGNSNSINTQATPNPNIEPGVFLNSSPGGTVYTNTVVNGTNATNQQAIMVDSAKQAAVPALNTKPVFKEDILAAPATKTATSPVAKSETVKTMDKPATASIDKPKATSSYSPLFSNFIPAEVIKKIKSKYGDAVYDITTVKVVKTNKIAYLVRLSENGSLRNELFYDEK